MKTFNEYKEKAIKDHNLFLECGEQISDMSEKDVIAYIKKIGVEEMCINVLKNNFISVFTDEECNVYKLELIK